MNKDRFQIRPAELRDAPTLAKLMVEGLNSRLNDLGPWFLTYLHRHMITSEHCLCFVAERSDTTIGYVALLTSTRKFYREFLLRKGFLCVPLTLPWLLRPKNLRTALSGLTYFPSAKNEDPEAELISMIVSPSASRAGVGTALFRELLQALRSRAVNEFKVCTSTKNDAANAFYRRQGCQHLRSDYLYRDEQINVYVYSHV